jgi:hypothetical protein
MTDPTLKKTSIKFGYTASDGYRMSFDAKGGAGTQHRVTGAEVPPEKALLEAMAELSRILALFGFGAEARAKFDAAQQAVADWRARRSDVALIEAQSKPKLCKHCKCTPTTYCPVKGFYGCEDADTDGVQASFKPCPDESACVGADRCMALCSQKDEATSGAQESTK